MKNFRCTLMLLIAIFAAPGIARALHLDVLTEQIGGQLVTGTGDFDHNAWILGPRVFQRDFDTSFAMNDPGFNSIGAGSPMLPAGSQALPDQTKLFWDFVPMTIGNRSSNLFYWNGLDSSGIPGTSPNDVAFSAPPLPSYALSLQDINFFSYSATGANAFVAGGEIAKSGTNGLPGSLHQHNQWSITDNDGDGNTLPADGLYLVAIRLRMPGLRNSMPVRMLFGTLNSSVEAEDDAAFPWLQQQTMLPGDYNGDGIVNAADYTVWRDKLGQTAPGDPADGSGNGIVDSADYDVWKSHFGQTAQITFPLLGGGSASSGLGTATVPEPKTAVLLLVGAAMAAGARRFVCSLAE